MPELPEVETVRVGLAGFLPGKQIKSVTHDWPKSFPNAKTDVAQFVYHAKIIAVRRRAKVLIIDLSSHYSLVIHLKMTGQLVYRGEHEHFGAGHPSGSLVGDLPDKSTRVVLTFTDGRIDMSTKVERVVAFGDSLMLGLGTTDRRGWVQMLHERYRGLNADIGPATKHPRIFYELGVFATKAGDVAANAAQELQARFWLPEEKEAYDSAKRLSIVSVGVNDSWLRVSGEHVTPLSTFASHAGRLAAVLAEKSQVLFVGLLPCDHEKTGAFWSTPTPPQIESRIRFEQAAIQEFGAVGARVVPMAEAAYQAPEFMDNLTADGVHGNEASERWVFERVAPHFDELVGIERRTSQSGT